MRGIELALHPLSLHLQDLLTWMRLDQCIETMRMDLRSEVRRITYIEVKELKEEIGRRETYERLVLDPGHR